VNKASLRLAEADRDLLESGAAGLGSELDRDMVTRLAHFAEVLDLWAARTNLVSCRSGHELVERHFLDSLATVPVLPSEGPLVDLGTGAGFPGIPVAIARTRQPVVLVETRRRRVSFLREVKRTLGLANVAIVEGRAEECPSQHRGTAAAVMTRAVWKDDLLPGGIVDWLAPGGSFVWMRSQPFTAPRDFIYLRRVRSLSYRVGSATPRFLEILLRDCST
jgi:16S rRNA (guanine527-N7)-methyltransferase